MIPLLRACAGLIGWAIAFSALYALQGAACASGWQSVAGVGGISVARLLLILAHFGKEGRPQPIAVELSQETLAEMIGTTRSRVSFFMNKFRKLGFISYNGKIEVHNSLLNAVLNDKPQIERDE